MPEPDVCTRASVSGEMVGAPCPDCGHTNIVHPFHTNTLTECLVCRMVVEVERLKRIGVVDGDSQ